MTRPPFPSRAECAAILRDAAALLEGRPKCAHTLARDAAGHACDVNDEDAASFCALGAILRFSPCFSAAQDVARVVAKKAPLDASLSVWNDCEDVSVRDVVRVFRSVAREIEG